MLIRRFIELLAPTECLECGAQGPVLCARCVDDVRPARQMCFMCRRDMPGGAMCEGCAEITRVRGITVGAAYDGAVKELIWRLKFHRLRDAADVAAGIVAKALPGELEVDVVTSIPVAPARYRERGYNQSELVARRVATRLGVPYTSLLGRENSLHQVGLGRQERLKQIKGVFYPLKALRGERVLVVDDVVTTGATLSECADVLVLAGAARVWGAAVAHQQAGPLE